MKNTIKSYLVLIFLLLGVHVQAAQQPIIGGTEVPAGHPIARMAVLIRGLEGRRIFTCSGSIIADDLILTAAHCLGRSHEAQLEVYFRTRLNGNGPVIQVVKQVLNSDYLNIRTNSIENWNDIALLKLAQKIPAGYTPVPLLADVGYLKNTMPVVLAGYGRNILKTKLGSDGVGVLRQVNQNILNAQWNEGEFLVDIRGKGSCHGDSGGPAYVLINGQYFLAGITSHLTEKNIDSSVAAWANGSGLYLRGGYGLCERCGAGTMDRPHGSGASLTIVVLSV